MANDILTESGTNEVEFLEFYLNDQSFAINVAKILQIITLEEDMITTTSNADPSVLGSLLWRDHTVDLIDLSAALNQKSIAENKSERPVVLVTTFNDISCGFKVDGVNRIYRASWDSIQPMDSLLGRYSPRFTGTIDINNKNILLVDFEKIVADLFESELSESSLVPKEQAGIPFSREDKHILFAEDSNLIRTNLTNYLKKAGYKIKSFDNGQKVYKYLQNYKREVSGEENVPVIDIIVTDIEMPQMDGLTLCRKIKEDKALKHIPVVIFSSLINEQMIVKCKEVGADDYISKPRAEELISKLDHMLAR